MDSFSDKNLISFLKGECSESERMEIIQLLTKRSDLEIRLKKLSKKVKSDEAKNKMLPHSEAKVQLFVNYLGIYLSILTRVPFVNGIKIFDLFCGKGFYENGKEGSPIKSFRMIRSVQAKLIRAKKGLKPITLVLNDINPGYIERIKSFIEEENKPDVFKCYPRYLNNDFEELVKPIITELNQDKSGTKNLVLIDPYGYGNIHRNDIESLLENNNTEIILFLPISQMYRFKQAAIRDDENKSYRKLRDFIHEFFPSNHPLVKGKKQSILEFIESIKLALRFNGKYYSTSFYIQRDLKSNMYALFFITPSQKGMEKILEAKWKMDDENGQGFKLKTNINKNNLPTLFDEYEEIQESKYERDLFDFLKEKRRSNIDVYNFTIEKEHLVKHTNSILRKLKKEKKIAVFDVYTDIRNNKGLYISNKEEKVIFKVQ